jgi:hypothetical protein
VQWDGKARRAVAGAVVKGVAPALAVTAVGMVLWQWDPQIASLVLLVGSFLLFLMSYRKPWRIRWYTCLLPPVAAVGGYVAQVYWFEVNKPIGRMGAGIFVGVALGLLRGRSHRLEIAKDNVVAHRTVVVLLLWLVTYLMTQSSALFGRSELAEWGLTGGAFTTTIVVVFSFVLLLRYRSMQRDLPRPRERAPATALAAGSLVLFAAATLAFTPPAAVAAEPSDVVLDGEWELDRREHHKCQVAVPPVVGGDIHIEADFEAGTIEGWFTGEGAGGYTMPAECDTEDPTTYDFEHEETWSGDFRSIDAVFVGELDPETGAFEATVEFSIDGDGVRQAPGHQYMCGTDYWTPTCVLPGFNDVIEGAISGVIAPTGTSDGIVDLYMPYCARITPGSIAWGIEGCPTIGEWEAGVTSVTWQENRVPEIAGISATPPDPSSDDTVIVTVDAMDPDDDELIYTWYVDGAANSAAGPSVTWAKPESGDHTIRVTVSDGADTVEAYLDLRVSEHVVGSDFDDDGVPDDEDRCPQEWGLGDDGCPEFAASVGCAPSRPIPEEAVSCSVDIAGKHIGETFLYDWYLDGGNVQSGKNAGWAWGEATDGDHEIIVDVTGEGRSATARLSLEVTGGITDAETAGFSVSAIGCNDGISSGEILGCSATITRTRNEVGALAVTWQLGGATIATETTDGSSTGWSLDGPPSGSHTVGVVVIDPLTNLGQAASTTVIIRAGSVELEEAAEAAALATAIGLLLAGSGLLTLNNITSALAGLSPEQIEETIRRATDHLPDLIDPRDGSVLVIDGDRVYWDDDVGWIDRTTAQDWIAEIAAQRLQRDLETEETWTSWMTDRRSLADIWAAEAAEQARRHGITDHLYNPETGTFYSPGYVRQLWDEALQQQLAADYERLESGLASAPGLADLHDFVVRNLDNVKYGDHWDPDQMRRLQQAVTRLGRAELGMDLARDYTYTDALWDTGGQFIRNPLVRVVAAIKTGGYSEIALQPAATLYAMETRTRAGMSAEDAARAAYHDTAMYAATTLTIGTIVTGLQETSEVWSELARRGGRAIGERLPEHITQAIREGASSVATGAQRTWRVLNTPLTELPDVYRISQLRNLNPELADVIDDMHQNISGNGLGIREAPTLAHTSPGQQQLWQVTDDAYALTANERAAAQILATNPAEYQAAVRAGLVPRNVHQVINHTRDKIIKHAMVRTFRNANAATRAGLTRIEITGTGARPHSAQATSGWTDFDCTAQGARNAEQTYTNAFNRELARGGPGMPGLDGRAIDSNMFAGLRPQAQAPTEGFGSDLMVEWQRADYYFRGTAVTPTDAGNLVFGQTPSAAVQGPTKWSTFFEGTPRYVPPSTGSALVQEAGDDVTALIQRHMSSPPTNALDTLRQHGKYVRRLWWVENAGTGASAPPGLGVLDQIKTDKTWVPTRDQLSAAANVFERYTGINPGAIP